MTVTREEAVAAAIKLLFALPVLRWPLAGAAISILADNLDILAMNYLDVGGGGIRDYHQFDKWTDLFGYVTFFVVALRFRPMDRAIAVFLWLVRITGIVLFELLHWRSALLLCPNLFETWFLYVLIRNAWFPDAPKTTRALVLGAMVTGKLGQEWILHGIQVLDRYNLSEVVDRILH